MNQKSNKKVCIVTWYRSMNYGTVIQCMALAKTIEALGYTPYVPERMNYWSVRDLPDFFRRVHRKLREKAKPANAQVSRSQVASEILDGYRMRDDRINQLISSELNVYPIPGRSAFRKLSGDMYAFVTGSDQIWNPNYISSPLLLSFVPDDKRKIAYSSSIGVTELPRNLITMYKRYLSRFYTIGVREKSAEHLLRGLVDVPVCTVLDPSFLLSREDWRKISDKAEIPDEYSKLQDFVFCYFIGGKKDWQQDASVLSERYGLPVVCCLSESLIIPENANVFADAGVREFLWMIDHASFVMTDSFHAAALSLNYRKEFAVYKRFEDADTTSQNSRIIDVLNLFHVENRLITPERNVISVFEEKIPYSNVERILAEEIEKSMKFLTKSLEE